MKKISLLILIILFLCIFLVTGCENGDFLTEDGTAEAYEDTADIPTVSHFKSVTNEAKVLLDDSGLEDIDGVKYVRHEAQDDMFEVRLVMEDWVILSMGISQNDPEFRSVWTSLIKELKKYTKRSTKYFRKAGLDSYSTIVHVIDPEDLDMTYLSVADGKVLFNCLDN